MQTQTKKKILVTGVGGPAGINISRLLQSRDDVHIIGCDIDQLAAGRFFVDEFLLSPRVSDEDEYKNWLKKIVSDKAIDLLIPTVDEELVPLSQFVSDVSCKVILSSAESLKIAADKFLSYTFVEKYLPELCPRFMKLSDWSVEEWKSDEYFIKPNNGRGARGCRTVTQAELVFLQSNTINTEDFIVMEILPGTEWTVDAYVAADGSVSYLVPRERIGLSGGISVKGRTVKNQSVIDATHQLISQLSMRGPVCIQWKQDESGKPKFIEVNPRLSGGLMITAASGADTAGAMLTELEGDIPPVQTWSEKTVVGYFTYQEFTDQ